MAEPSSIPNIPTWSPAPNYDWYLSTERLNTQCGVTLQARNWGHSQRLWELKLKFSETSANTNHRELVSLPLQWNPFAHAKENHASGQLKSISTSPENSSEVQLQHDGKIFRDFYPSELQGVFKINYQGQRGRAGGWALALHTADLGSILVPCMVPWARQGVVSEHRVRNKLWASSSMVLKLKITEKESA